MVFAPSFQQLENNICGSLTLHTQNTRATVNCGQSKPNLQEVELLSALLLMEQTVLDACTLRKSCQVVKRRSYILGMRRYGLTFSMLAISIETTPIDVLITVDTKIVIISTIRCDIIADGGYNSAGAKEDKM